MAHLQKRSLLTTRLKEEYCAYADGGSIMQEEHPEQVAWPQGTQPSQAVVIGMQTPATSSKPGGPFKQKPRLPKQPNPARKYASHPSAFHAASQKPPPPEQSTSTTRDCDTEPSETPDAATERYQKEVYRGRCVLLALCPRALHTQRGRITSQWPQGPGGTRFPSGAVLRPC